MVFVYPIVLVKVCRQPGGQLDHQIWNTDDRKVAPLTNLQSQFVGVSPHMEDDTAGAAEEEWQPHVHRGGGVEGADYQEDPVHCVRPEKDSGQVRSFLAG